MMHPWCQELGKLYVRRRDGKSERASNGPQTHLKRASNAAQTHVKRTSNACQARFKRTCMSLGTRHLYLVTSLNLLKPHILINVSTNVSNSRFGKRPTA